MFDYLALYERPVGVHGPASGYFYKTGIERDFLHFEAANSDKALRKAKRLRRRGEKLVQLCRIKVVEEINVGKKSK